MAKTQDSFKSNPTGPSQAPADKSLNQSSSINNSASIVSNSKSNSVTDPLRIESSGSASISAPA
jgi:hypothetical protein